MCSAGEKGLNRPYLNIKRDLGFILFTFVKLNEKYGENYH
jgi:hypothetical protein